MEETTTAVIVVHDSPLRGDCLTRILAAELGRPVIGLGSVDELKHVSNGVALVLLDSGGRTLTHPMTLRSVNQVRHFVPDLAIVVIAEKIDLDQARQAAALNIQGFISSDEKLDIVVAAVRLIMAGGKYYSHAADLTFTCEAKSEPNEASMRVAEDAGIRPTPIASIAPGARKLPCSLKFTPREMDVFGHLQQGLPNKLIANRLNLSENTVKVHIRRIMRKLRVTNRTEAALSSPVGERDDEKGLGPLSVSR